MFNLMEKLFGKWPETSTPVVNDTVRHIEEQEHIDPMLQKRFHRVIDHIRTSLKTHKFGKILSETENSVMHTKISKIQFDGNDSCVITFNDRPQDDEFELEWDIDHNPQLAHDIYEVTIEVDGTIVVERWRPDDGGMMHFAPVDHEDIVKMIWFTERCMNLSAAETII